MADVKVTFTDPDGTVLDQFTVFKGSKPQPLWEYGAGQDAYTDVDLANNLRECIEYKFPGTSSA